MSNPLEITGDDIARLDDAAFRTLIAYLCEADLRKAGISPACVDASGHQNAGDGGLDVKVCTPINPPRDSFIPRRLSGFQVKTSPMPASAIKKEMRPRGKLRPVIAELAQAGGAYLIVSSKDNLSQTSQSTRLRAMKTALGKAKGRSKLLLQVFDRNKVAQWVRSHPALVAWVRSQVGRPISGWQPYDNWSNSPGGIGDEYLLDNKVRFHDRTSLDTDGLNVLAGIRKLRTLLSSSRESVRIAGLSGTGKTRLVQALFDERIAENALNRFAVIYTDMSHEPQPKPPEMATWLASSGERILLIVDNCPQELHNTLSAICMASRSALSLVTVEYDVQDDRPAETSVFKLEPASEHVIDELVLRRFPHITDVDRAQIASFSGGNARIAIAIAGTVRKGESIAHLRDADLFDPLFRQRNAADRGLRSSAELCALVYSFDGEDVSPNSELALLAGLRNKPVGDIFSDLADLRKRDLLQARGQWRAILPPALANFLATTALEAIPPIKVIDAFLSHERILKSFSRRLSYLAESSVAKGIALQLLRLVEQGLPNLNNIGIALFENLAPLALEESLAICERTMATHGNDWFGASKTQYRWENCRILWHLAYEERHFEKATSVLIQFAQQEKPETSSPGRQFLKLLFHCRYSGTLAQPATRLRVLRGLLESDDISTQSIGIELLKSALETDFHGTHESYEFGGRSRDYGYFPLTRPEIVDWFAHFFELVGQFGGLHSPIGERVRDLLAEEFFGLWVHVELYDEVSALVEEIHRQCKWPGGWAVVRRVLQYRNLSKECIRAATALEQKLAPRDIIEKVRWIAISPCPETLEIGCINDSGDSYTTAWHRSQRVASEIGFEVTSKNYRLVEQLLPEIVRSDGPRVFAFVSGMVRGSRKPEMLLKKLVGMYCSTPLNARKLLPIYGLLSGLADLNAKLANVALEQLSNEAEFAQVFPELQLVHAIDEAAFARLQRSIASGLVNGDAFRQLSFTRLQRQLGDERLLSLLTKVQVLPGGYEVVIHAMAGRFRDGQERDSTKDVKAFGRKLLEQFTIKERRGPRQELDYDLATVVDHCVSRRIGARCAAHLCHTLVNGFSTYVIYHFDYPKTLQALAVANPKVFLNEMLGGDRSGERVKAHTAYFGDGTGNPFDRISDAEMLAWCEIQPDVRYPKVAAAILPFEANDKSEPLRWRSLATEILKRAPDIVATVAVFAHSLFDFSSWSGSRAAILERRIELLKHLFDHENQAVSDAARARYVDLHGQIAEERKHERARERRHESFE